MSFDRQYIILLGINIKILIIKQGIQNSQSQ